MRLLKLTSSNPKFRTIEFKSGVNIIVGTQLTQEQKKSINGIGKSMSLSLIHFMFGASFKTNAEKKLEKFLANYGEFYLSFVHNSVNYVIKKDFSKSDFFINNDKKSKSAYKKELNLIFLGDKDAKPSFKQIFNCFARRYSSETSYYSNILKQQGRPLEDYHQRYVNLFLLGIDLELVEESYTIKEKLTKLRKAKSTIEEYQRVLDDSNINDIKDEIVRLEIQLKKFVIAENFEKLKKEADELTLSLNEIRNKIYVLKNKLKRKENSLESSKNTDIDLNKIEELFQEANFFFGDQVSKRLSQAQEFHKNLINNRKNRLASEIEDIKVLLSELKLDREEVAEKRDKLLKDLDNTGALEERDSLKDRISTLEKEQKDLEKFEDLLIDFKKDTSKLNVDDAMIKNRSISYLLKNQKYIEGIESKFRTLVKQFYDHQGGSFKIEETQNAKYLFDIISHIPKEGSQGVGEVKIFCYDILLYLLNKELLGFLAHDGCIFSEMDPRQKSTIFKVLLETSKENDFQYFVNIVDNSLNEILDFENKINILDDSEKDIIKDSIRLKLTDKTSEDWLFGVGFD